MKNTAAIVLAAGKGTRINATTRNKVTLTLDGKPMIAHTLDNLKRSGIGQVVVVVGYLADSVKESLGPDLDYAVQDPPRGTGDAVRVGLPHLKPNINNVIVVYGDDSAFYPPELYKKLEMKISAKNADMIVVTLIKDNPTGLGRIVRDDSGNIARIVEEKVATVQEKKIKEINTAMSCSNRILLDNLIGKIQENPVSKEFYFTDIVELAIKNGYTVKPHVLEDESYWQGVNTREELKLARNKFKSHDK